MFKKEQLKKLIIPILVLTIIEFILCPIYHEVVVMGRYDFPPWYIMMWDSMYLLSYALAVDILFFLLLCLVLNLIFALFCRIFHKPVRMSYVLIWLSFAPIAYATLGAYLRNIWGIF